MPWGIFAAIFELLDLFGSQPSINFKGRDKSYSFCSLLSTTLVGVISITILIFFSSDFVNRTNPSITQSKLLGVTANQDFKLTDDIFKFAFAVLDKYNNFFYDPSYWTGEGNILRADGQTIPLEFSACPAAYGSEYTGYMCFKNPGSLVLAPNGYIYFKLYGCGSTCPADALDKLSSSRVVVKYLDQIVDPNNFTNPLTAYMKSTEVYFMSTLTKMIDLQMQILSFSSDDSWFLSSTKTWDAIIVENFVIDYKQMSDDTLFRFKMYNNGNKLMYSRGYQKIQDVIANFQGMITYVLLIFGFAVFPFTRVKMYEEVINDVYQINMQTPSNSNNGNSPGLQRLKTSTSKNIQQIRTRTRSWWRKSTNITAGASQSPNDHKPSKKISVNYFDWLRSHFMSVPKVKVLNKGISEITDKIDIVTLVKKLRELEMLKQCLLTPQQRILFDNIGNAELVFDSKANLKAKDTVKLLEYIDPTEKDKQRVEENYKALKRAETKTQVCGNILSMFESSKAPLKAENVENDLEIVDESRLQEHESSSQISNITHKIDISDESPGVRVKFSETPFVRAKPPNKALDNWSMLDESRVSYYDDKQADVSRDFMLQEQKGQKDNDEEIACPIFTPHKGHFTIRANTKVNARLKDSRGGAADRNVKVTQTVQGNKAQKLILFKPTNRLNQ